MVIEYIFVFIPARIQKIQKEEAESPTLHLEWKLQPDWVIITTLEKRLEGLGSYKNVLKIQEKGGGGPLGPSPKSAYVILNAKKYDSSCSSLHSLSLSWHWRICIPKVFYYMASSGSGQDAARLHVMTVIVLYFFNFKVGKWSPSQGVVMFPQKPVLWLSQSLLTPRDRAGTVENISVRVITAIVCWS